MASREAFLSSFYSLASAEDAERSAAACAIAVHLNSEQRSFEAAGAAVPEGLSDAFAQAGACRELVYAIKRLVRGLTSSRGCARQGFATALARVISDDALAKPTPLRCILVLLDETTDCPNGLKGQEAREKLFGRIFGYVALQRSGRLYAAAGANESVDSAVEAQMARALLLIGRQKPYLREVCAQAVAALVWSAPSVKALRAKLLPALKAEWEGECIEWTAEQLGLAFHVAHFIALRGDGDDELPAWLDSVIAATASTRSNAEQWCPALVDSARTFPRVHSIWGILATSAAALAAAYTRDGATTSLVDDAARFGSTRTGSLELVWAAVVEPHLVKKGSTDQRKFLGLELVARLMASESTDPALRPRLLTAQVVACIVNNCGSANSYVQTPAKRALEAVEGAIVRAASAAAAAPKAKKAKKSKKAAKKAAAQSGGAGELSVLFALLEHSSAAHGGRAKGSGNKKDGRSKGAAMVMEVTGRLLGSLDASAIAAYIGWVASHLSATVSSSRVSAESESDAAEAAKDALEMKQLWAAQTLSSTLANARLPRSAAWMGAAMRALEDGAFGTPAAPVLSLRVQSQCESYFFKSLHALSTSAVSASQRLGGVQAGELDWTALFARVAARQSALVARLAAGRAPIATLSKRAAKLLVSLAARRAARAKAAPSRKRKRSDGIDAASAHADALYACQVLIGASAFTLARAPGAAARAAEQLSELCDCADAFLGSKAGTVAVLMRAPIAAADAESSDSEAEEDAMEGAQEVAVPAASIVVELLLSMLSDPLPGVRDLVKAVFGLLCPSLAVDAVLELCDIVATSEGMLDVNVDGDSEDEEESDNGDGKRFTAADLTVGDVDAAMGNSWKSEASSDDGDSDGDEKEGGDAVSRAERENEMLSAIVRMRVMKRDGLKESRNLKNKQIDFRLRVLDLVETFVTRMPSSPIVLDLVVPLLNALRATGGTLRGGARAGKSGRQVRGLHDRLRTVIVNRVCGAKLLPTLELEAAAAAELHVRAEAAMAHALGAQLPDVNESAGVAAIYLLRILARNGALDVARARAVLRKAALNLLCTKRSRVRKRFFELLAKPAELSAATWSVVPTLLNIAAGAETVTVMKKVETEEEDEEEAKEEEVEVVMRPRSACQRAQAYELIALALNAAAADAALYSEAAAAMPALLRAFATAAREHAETGDKIYMQRENGVYVVKVNVDTGESKKKATIVVDSGASECVMPKKWLEELPKMKAAAGIKFTCAKGNDLGNYGRKLVEFKPICTRPA